MENTAHLTVSDYHRSWSSAMPGIQPKHCLPLSTLHRTRLKQRKIIFACLKTEILIPIHHQSGRITTLLTCWFWPDGISQGYETAELSRWAYDSSLAERPGRCSGKNHALGVQYGQGGGMARRGKSGSPFLLPEKIKLIGMAL